ncbi:unnamed protein product [Alternaria sp. RS040]
MEERNSLVGCIDPPRDLITSANMEEIIWRDEYVASDQERKTAIEAAIAGRTRCRKLANKLHIVLPRELRNMIYTYIVGPSAQLEYAFDIHGIIQIGFFESGQYEDLSMFGESCQIQPRSWAMDPSYFGTDVAIELAEAYYALNRFALTSEQFLYPFLTFDPLALGIKPYEHIRRLDLTLDFEDAHDVNFADVATHLQALQLIPSKRRKMDIYVNLTTSFTPYVNTKFKYSVEAERIMLNILELLRWPIYELLHKGHAVQVLHENVDGEDRTSPQIPQRNLTSYCSSGSKMSHMADFFYMTKEEWLKEKGRETVADPASHHIFSLSAVGDEVYHADEMLEKVVRRALKRRWDKDHALKGFNHGHEN